MSKRTMTDSGSLVTNEAVERTRDSLRGLGELWASYGLHVARTSLEASAKTLQTTVSCLDQLRHGLIGDAERRPFGSNGTRW